MAALIVEKSNDKTFFVEELSGDDGEFINDATITATLFVIETHDDVTNAVDLPATYITGSNGRYSGVIPSTVTELLTAGEGRYVLEITGTAGTRDLFIEKAVTVIDRTS